MSKRSEISDLARRIQDRLNALELSARKASEMAGLSPDAIRNIMRKPESLPRGRTLLNLARVLGVSEQYLLTGEDAAPAPEAFGVKFGGVVEAGAFRANDLLDQDAESVLVSIPADGRYPVDHQVCFKVIGDSMTEAKIFEGMYVLALDVMTWERFHGEPGDGRLVIVARSRNGEPERELTVKRLRLFRDRMELCPESNNPAHQPFVFPLPISEDDSRDVQIIAVVLNATWLFA